MNPEAVEYYTETVKTVRQFYLFWRKQQFYYIPCCVNSTITVIFKKAYPFEIFQI